MSSDIQSFSSVKELYGKEVYGVKIDESLELTQLLEKAESCRDLPPDQKLQAVQNLALGAMKNAWEEFRIAADPKQKEKFRNIVYTDHPLSDALKERAGCCRYQSVLFCMLAGVARLGKEHYVQSASVGNGVNTCFNDVVQDGKTQHISIFSKSLKDPALNYTQDSNIYERARTYFPGQTFLSYKVGEDGEAVFSLRQDAHAGVDLKREEERRDIERMKEYCRSQMERPYGNAKRLADSIENNGAFSEEGKRELLAYLAELVQQKKA